MPTNKTVFIISRLGILFSIFILFFIVIIAIIKFYPNIYLQGADYRKTFEQAKIKEDESKINAENRQRLKELEQAKIKIKEALKDNLTPEERNAKRLKELEEFKNRLK
jgi:hypothetical protein